MEKLVVNFDFSKRRSARISSLTPDSESHTTKYGRKLQQNAPEKYQEYKEKEENIFLSGCKADKTKMRYDTSGLLQRELRESGRNSRSLRKIRVKGPEFMEKELATTCWRASKTWTRQSAMKMASKRERRCHKKILAERQWILEERIWRNHLLLNCQVHHHCQHHKQVLKTNVDHHCQHQQQAGLQHQQQAGLHTSGSRRKWENRCQVHPSLTPSASKNWCRQVQTVNGNKWSRKRFYLQPLKKKIIAQQLSVVEGIQKNVSKLKSNPSNSISEFLHRLAHAAGKFRRSQGFSWKYRKQWNGSRQLGRWSRGKNCDLVKEFWYEVSREFVKKCVPTYMLETSYIQAIQEIQTRAEGGVCELHKVEATKCPPNEGTRTSSVLLYQVRKMLHIASGP